MSELGRQEVGDDWEPRLSALLTDVHRVLGEAREQCLCAGPADMPAILARNRLGLYAALERVGNWIVDFLSQAHDRAEQHAARRLVVNSLRPASVTGPFFDRSFGKLRGYPGDFETIELIYRCRPSGATLEALILDDYYLHTLAAQAVRNRLTYLIGRIRQETQRRSAPKCPPVRVLSLGSGSARELAMLSKEPDFVSQTSVTCLDLDSEALRFARKELGPRYDGQVRYIKGNALEFAAGPGRYTEPYHLIYAAGLFDYLRDSQARQLIGDCHGLLAQGGTLILGNFSAQLPPAERVLIEWLLEWRLLYRDEDDYRRIFAGTGFALEDVRFDYEPLRVNLFAVAAK